DGVVEVGAEEAARESVELARKEGVFVGLSSGAVVRAYKEVLERGELSGGDVVLVLPDMGFKYVDIIAELLGL
ncbi:MAG: pyridoxal-phosphate dependent enzyme, partial [Acidilobaceae archaeon]